MLGIKIPSSVLELLLKVVVVKKRRGSPPQPSNPIKFFHSLLQGKTPRRHRRVFSTDMKKSGKLGDFSLAKRIFLSGVESVSPTTLIRNQIKLTDGLHLEIQHSTSISLNHYQNCYVVGFGKAVLPMAEELLRILGSRVTRTVLSVPLGTRQSTNPNIETFRGAKNNIPDEDAVEGAKRILELTNNCKEEDLLFILISGGGSALLPCPKPPVTLEEKSQVIRALSKAGAQILHLNIVRKEISEVKGGGLIRNCKAKGIFSLILSDVLGDPIEMIASGPTVPSITNDAPQAIKTLKKFMKTSEIPNSVLTLLQNTNRKLESSKHPQVSNILIGSNRIALEAAAVEAKNSNLIPIILTSTLDGDANEIGDVLAHLAHWTSEFLRLGDEGKTRKEISKILETLKISGIKETLMRGLERGRKTNTGVCLLLGGETTVVVKGEGKGGRNQQLCLSTALQLHQIYKSPSDPNDLDLGEEGQGREITILSGGTDGIDGPCDAAGAIINPWTVKTAKKEDLDPVVYLTSNDSYHFFQRASGGAYHLVIGHTGTNVMDMVVLLVR